MGARQYVAAPRRHAGQADDRRWPGRLGHAGVRGHTGARKLDQTAFAERRSVCVGTAPAHVPQCRWTMSQDVAQVEGVRRAMGDDFTILVDANQAQQPGTTMPEEGPLWTYERALLTARELQRLGVFWLEEPLDRYDFDGLSRLCAAVEILIPGGGHKRSRHPGGWLIRP